MVIMVRTNAPRAWQVAEAKAKLSELLAKAVTGPQTIERRGKPVAVVVGIEAYAAATEQLLSASVEARMARFLEHCAALRARGGVTLRVGRRASRPSPFEHEA
jgi:prevent-host-death family protein